MTHEVATLATLPPVPTGSTYASGSDRPQAADRPGCYIAPAPREDRRDRTDPPAAGVRRQLRRRGTPPDRSRGRARGHAGVAGRVRPADGVEHAAAARPARRGRGEGDVLRR